MKTYLSIFFVGIAMAGMLTTIHYHCNSEIGLSIGGMLFGGGIYGAIRFNKE